ncbi:Histone acetyltransferase [Quillaja saponaria]|uniref:Histone acetyltransferase n=1 Tax=Quillaja saponaria TaxID=32244 RepID=A0AAD7QCP0_QUISA|nr:Histone acetyltransferase [Quillaja saponaria]
MPRPGPRPYECVRRAWHSERHQPMRGNIIQQIFRVVNESHSATTKKKKEWQEKLPTVVLKAEEIMYSKANSEAEYLNLDTLWDRVNDAINTIIRRDESTETGELLPPCVEAALNLGCVPVRASRSQRHSNPRTYLSPRPQESPGPPKTIGEPRSQLLPLQSGSPLHFAKSTTTISALPVSDSDKHANQNTNVRTPCCYPFSLENYPAGHNQLLTKETKTQLNLGSTYPLYYGTQYQTKDPQLSTIATANTCSKPIFIGTPISTTFLEPGENGLMRNFLTCGSVEHVSNRTIYGTAIGTQEKTRGRECDLSLRLGLFSQPSMSSEKSSACETEDVGSSSSQEGSKFSHLSAQMDKEFTFYPGRTAYDPSESRSTRWNSDVEDKNLETTFRKRKAPFGNNEEDGQFCRQIEVPYNQFTGHITRPGVKKVLQWKPNLSPTSISCCCR